MEPFALCARINIEKIGFIDELLWICIAEDANSAWSKCEEWIQIQLREPGLVEGMCNFTPEFLVMFSVDECQDTLLEVSLYFQTIKWDRQAWTFVYDYRPQSEIHEGFDE